MCDEIIYVMDIVSKTSTMATNVSINCHSEKVIYKIDCYIFRTVLFVIILLFIIAIICSNYTNYCSKQKDIDALTICKWRIMNLIKFVLKTVHPIVSMS